MSTPSKDDSKATDFLWLVTPRGRETRVVSIRAIGWFSLLKLLIVGFAFGSLPFVVLLNFGIAISPGSVTEEVKRAVSFPAVLWIWPLAVLAVAWFTNFFVAAGIRLFGIFSPMRLKVLVDEKTEPNKAPEPTTMAVTSRAPSSTSRASHGRGSS